MNSLVLLGAGGVLLYLMSGKKETKAQKDSAENSNQIYSVDPNSIQFQPNKPNNNGSLGSLNSFGSNASGSNNSNIGLNGILTPKNTPNKGTFGLKSNSIPAFDYIFD